MSDQERPLRSVFLKNGLEVRFFDGSKKTAGDRWQVRLIMEVPLKVEESYFSDLPNPREAFEGFVGEFTTRTFFRREKVRNFIDEKEVGSLLKSLMDESLDAGARYLESGEFPRRAILKQYFDWEKDRSWQRCYREHLEGASGAKK
ncbi:MAG TPA: hypothetical protein PLM79_12700 [Syntrophobacteraceae bacterium]|nr:hypothetical protein [Syntrophobacteraceae bacterium]